MAAAEELKKIKTKKFQILGQALKNN